MKFLLKSSLALLPLFTLSCAAQKAQVATGAKDTTAEKMLIYQRSVGGWPKAVAGGVKVDYHKVLTATDLKAAVETGPKSDATIDNNATTREITYLVEAYNSTKNPVYLTSAEKGIAYLLKAQNANGGWPQYYPDSSLYRAQITFNDNAMINAMNVLYNVANRTKGFEVVNQALVSPAQNAIDKGLQCILKTQVSVNGKRTVWCQQYDRRTLKPAVARKFELIGLSTSESVGIVEYMLRLKSPSADVIASVKSAMQWFTDSKIKGYRFDHIDDASQPTKKDAVLVVDAASTIWARFYEIESNRPFFSGRDSEMKYKLTEIENERRAGYAWYGTWPKKLIEKSYPEWLKKNNLN